VLVLVVVARRLPEAALALVWVILRVVLCVVVVVVVVELIVEVEVLLVCVVVELVVVLVALVVVLIVVVVVVVVVDVILLGRKARIITPVVAQSKINTTPARQQESCGVQMHRKHCLRSHCSDSALSLSKVPSSWWSVEPVVSVTGGSWCSCVVESVSAGTRAL